MGAKAHRKKGGGTVRHQLKQIRKEDGPGTPKYDATVKRRWWGNK